MPNRFWNTSSLALLTLVSAAAVTEGLSQKCLAQDAAASQIANRKALVIGNGKYVRLPAVQSVAPDIQLVGSALKSAGFEVVEVKDAGIRDLTSAIKSFTGKIAKGDIAFLYYSGLAVQSNQENYLLPVDFSEKESNLFSDAYSLSRIDFELGQRGAAARVLILDACRDVAALLAKYESGLAVPQLNEPGVLIAFSAQPGRVVVSKDAAGPSLFAKEISQALTTPGLSIEQIFSKTQAAVSEASAQAQIPTYFPFRIASLRLKESPPGSPASSTPTSAESPSAGVHRPGRYEAVVIGSFIPAKGVNVPAKVLERLTPALTEQLSSWKLREIVTDEKKLTAPSALKIEGTITSYTAGSRVARFTIGYGVGTARTKGLVRLTDVKTGKVLYEEDNVLGFVGGGAGGGHAEDAMNYFAEAILKVLVKSGLL